MRKTRKSIKSISKYLPILIILLSITIMVGSTFAYFTDRKEDTSNLTFSKVELSSETTLGVNGAIHDVIPGSKLIDGDVAFSKAIDSEAIYVRAKVSFSLPSEYKNDTDMQGLLDKLRSATNFNIESGEQAGGAVWSEKMGNYFYLVTKDDATKLMRVDTIDTYVLSSDMVVPRDLEQLDGNAQYMKSINFHIAFEAIQADNVSDVLADTKEVFNELFPENNNEKIDVEKVEKPFYNLTIKNQGDEQTFVKSSSIKIDEPVAYKSGYKFDGWYSQDGSQSGNWGDKISFPLAMNEDIELNAKFTEEYSEGLTFNEILENEVAVAYSVNCQSCVDENVVVPEYYNNLPVTTIENAGFVDMVAHLKSVTLPNTITTIGTSAFASCMSLQSIVIPSSVTSIGSDAFYNCTALYEVYNYSDLNIVPGSEDYGYLALNAVAVYDEGEYSKAEIDENGYKFFDGGEDNTWLIGYESRKQNYSGMLYPNKSNNLILPESFKGYKYGLANYVFANDSNIANIQLPDGLKEIGKGAFNSCLQLRELVIPEGVTYLEYETLHFCNNLIKVVIPSTMEYINVLPDNEATSAFNKLVEIVNKSDLEIVIGEQIASFALNVITDEADSKIKTQGDYKFYDDGTDVYLIQYIGDELEITLPEYYNGRTYKLYEYAFQYSNIVSVTTPSTMTELSDYAFLNAYNLQRVILHDNITIINENAFESCFRLYDVKMPASLETIEAFAFYNCYNLVSITIPSNVTLISDSAFLCPQLLEIYNYSTLEFEKGTETHGSIALKAINIFTGNEESKVVVDENGFVFYDEYMPGVEGLNVKYLLNYRGSETNLVLPDDFNGDEYILWDYAFATRAEIESIDLPDDLLYIGEGAFLSCIYLKVEIPKSVLEIGYYAFGMMFRPNITFGGNVSEWQLPTSGYMFNYIMFDTSSELIRIKANDGYIEYQKEAGECLIEGTMITLADGSKKAIENITYDDLLLVWNYDLGRFDYAYPVWIEQKGTSSSYTKVVLENGFELGAVGVHGVFNADLNCFVDVNDVRVNDNLIVTTIDGNGNKVLTKSKVVSIGVVDEVVNYYQVLTGVYFNVFANDILTTEGNVFLSNRYGFDDNVKWDNELREEVKQNLVYDYADFSDVMDYYLFNGLTVGEGKFLVEMGYITFEEFKNFVINQAVNQDMLLKPNTVIVNGQDVRLWNVTISYEGDISNPIKVVEGDNFTLREAQVIDGKTFIGYRCSTDGKIYNVGDSVTIWYGTHFTAIYE